VGGYGFSNNNEAIIRIMDSVGNDYPVGPVGLPYNTTPVPPNRRYTISAQDTQTKDDNDLSGYLWSNSVTVQS
jgi:hypothetical protein